MIDLTGQKFGEWTALEWKGDGRWICKCSCGNWKILPINLVASGRSKSCGHATTALKDISGRKFGKLLAIRYTKDKLWECKCDCGNIVYKKGSQLLGMKVQSCGCSRLKKNKTKYVGYKFGSLTVIRYVDNFSWECKCDCGNIKIVREANLLNGTTKSCGCLRKLIIDSKPSQHDIENIAKEYTYKNGNEPFVEDIANALDLSVGYTDRLLTDYNIRHILNKKFDSSFEYQIFNILKNYTDNIVIHNRNIIYPNELDIYIPEFKTAIEVNGNYYHDVNIVGAQYHQNKTIKCIQRDIRLIHIFENEWKHNKDDIIYILDGIFNNKNIEENNIYANIDSIKYNKSYINIKDENVIDFHTKNDFELAYLLKYYIDKFNISELNILVDLSKFTGNDLLKLGFKTNKNNLSKPSFKNVDGYIIYDCGTLKYTYKE